MAGEMENVGVERPYPFEFGQFTDDAGRARWRVRDNRLGRVCDCWAMEDAMLIADLLNVNAAMAEQVTQEHLRMDA